MEMIANSPKMAKKVGVSQSVGKDFAAADKGKTFKRGGMMKPVDMKQNPGMAKLPTAVRNKMGFMKHGGMAMKKPVKKMMGGGMAKGGGIETKGKTKGKMITMKSGGKAC